MAILIAADFSPAEWADWWPALQAALPGERLLRERPPGGSGLDPIEIALVANPPVGALRDLPALRLVQSLWAGVERLLADATLPANVPLARMVDPAMNDAMAQTALWAVLGLHRGFIGRSVVADSGERAAGAAAASYAAQQARAQWCAHPQRRADAVHVVVLGLGQMGRASAQRLAASGYRVSGWSRSACVLAGVSTHAGSAALVPLLGTAQIVVNLLPLTAATRGLFNAASFATLPRGACLVNLARGAHVVEADLLDALASGQIAHAVLDVFATEPLPPAHPFWHHPHVTVLPHIAAQTDPRSAAAVAGANIRSLREGQPLRHLVDRQRGY